MNNSNETSQEQANSKFDIRTLSREELGDYLKQNKEPKFRGKQIEEWVWQKNAASFDEMTNLSKGLRDKLSDSFTLNTVKELTKQISTDGSRKYLLGYEDGASVECVGMPNKNKLAVCVSSQAGCGMGCVFCATGNAGFDRSLKALEIYDQVMHVQRDFGVPVTSVVFMGQGEPLNNYDELMKVLRMLNDPNKANIGARHLTVSTCGIIPKITRFAKEPEQFTLAISLHSAVQETRNQLMPGVKKYSLLHLHEAMENYTAKTGRRPTYEYAMISGVNDSEFDLDALCDFCKKTLCHVNLIQLNEIPGSKFKPSTQGKVDLFVRKLSNVGVETTVRNSRGSDIDAACGQLKQRF